MPQRKVLICLFSLLLCYSGAFGQDKKLQKKIGGINLVSPRHATETDYVKSTKRVGANWIAVIPYAFMKSNKPGIEYNKGENWWGGTPEGIAKTNKYCRKNGLKVLLKPHFWVDGKSWAGELEFNESDWKEWEKNYESFILSMAKTSERYQFEMLCIGTEMKSAVNRRPEFWLNLIPKIRAVYKGKLIYAANWDNFHAYPLLAFDGLYWY